GGLTPNGPLRKHHHKIAQLMRTFGRGAGTSAAFGRGRTLLDRPRKTWNLACFPDRDLIQLTAFVVVLGTLVLQGLTLRPLLLFLGLPKDSIIADELRLARETGLNAAMAALAGDTSAAAERLRQRYAEALAQARSGVDPSD